MPSPVFPLQNVRTENQTRRDMGIAETMPEERMITTSGLSIYGFPNAGFSDGGWAELPDRSVIEFQDDGFPYGHRG